MQYLNHAVFTKHGNTYFEMEKDLIQGHLSFYPKRKIISIAVHHLPHLVVVFRSWPLHTGPFVLFHSWLVQYATVLCPFTPGQHTLALLSLFIANPILKKTLVKFSSLAPNTQDPGSSLIPEHTLLDVNMLSTNHILVPQHRVPCTRSKCFICSWALNSWTWCLIHPEVPLIRLRYIMYWTQTDLDIPLLDPLRWQDC